MKNPCKQCLVLPMCSIHCIDKMEYDAAEDSINIKDVVIDSFVGFCILATFAVVAVALMAS